MSMDKSVGPEGEDTTREEIMKGIKMNLRGDGFSSPLTDFPFYSEVGGLNRLEILPKYYAAYTCPFRPINHFQLRIISPLG